MALYIAKRLALIPAVLLGVVTLVFLLTHMIPGTPVRVLLGPHATAAQIERVTAEYGLDRPLLDQYAIYVWKLLHGDLGRSIITGKSVLSDLGRYLPATIELLVAALLIIVLLGLSLGVVAAVYRNGLPDFLARGFTVGGEAMPQFWLGLMGVVVFYYWLGVLPAGGKLDPRIEAPYHITGMYGLDSLLTGNWTALWSAFQHLVLPAVTLAVTNLSTIARMTRASLLKALREDYVTMARASGFGPFKVNFVYALKNALTPVISVIGLITGSLLGGAFLVETVFDWPGIGLYATRSITNIDYSPVIGVALFTSFSYVVINIVVDVAYTWIDPRIKY